MFEVGQRVTICDGRNDDDAPIVFVGAMVSLIGRTGTVLARSFCGGRYVYRVEVIARNGRATVWNYIEKWLSPECEPLKKTVTRQDKAALTRFLNEF